jgi:hypothetical protein
LNLKYLKIYFKLKKKLSKPQWLAKGLEPNRELLPVHLPSILHGHALVGAGSLGPSTDDAYFDH